MTYAHCRGCGIELYSDDPSAGDGLCIGLESEDDVKDRDGGCTASCQEWQEAKGRPRLKMVGWWLTSEWTIAIDEWLAATR